MKTKKISLLLILVLLIATTMLISCGEERKNNNELIEERINLFLTSYNDGDMDAVMSCLDAKSRNALQAIMNIFGDITGFEIDLSDLFSLGIATSSGDFMKLDIININIKDSKNAVVTTKMDLGYTKGTIVYFIMVYENEGWYISDMTDKKSDNTNSTPTTNDNNNDAENLYTLSTYSYTDEHGNAGAYSELNKSYSSGECVTLTATVNSGYNFEGWFINGTCISEDLNFVYKMKSSDVSLEARYSYYTVSTYSDTDDHSQAGIFTEFNSKKISIGETVTLTATVNDGYNFEGWYINDICVSNDPTYKFTMKNKNVILESRYSSYSITTYSDTNLEGTIGTYTQINEKKASKGDTITVVAQPSEGCNFEGWYLWIDWSDSVCVCEDLEYTFEMEKKDIKLEARFSAYTLTTDAFLLTDDFLLNYLEPGINVDFFRTYSYSDYEPSMGDYTKYNNKHIAKGEEITLTATEKSGYSFLAWKKGFDLISTDHTYTFVMNESDVIYEAVYIINK
ncbi:MAG: InlB B-repeat-containing protein [Clostridia bacterium]|nr:InlB B-repeat-containing protein [Clostridia bacterium]